MTPSVTPAVRVARPKGGNKQPFKGRALRRALPFPRTGGPLRACAHPTPPAPLPLLLELVTSSVPPGVWRVLDSHGGFVDNQDGTYSGSYTPTVSGTFPYTVTVTDSGGNKGTFNCSVTVYPPISATCVVINAVQNVPITPVTMTATGDLRTLSQQGWEIRYEAFKSVENYRFPTKIVLKHESMEIVMSIHDWNPNLVAE